MMRRTSGAMMRRTLRSMNMHPLDCSDHPMLSCSVPQKIPGATQLTPSGKEITAHLCDVRLAGNNVAGLFEGYQANDQSCKGIEMPNPNLVRYQNTMTGEWS